MPESEKTPLQWYAFVLMAYGFMCQMAVNFGSNTTAQTLSTMTEAFGVSVADGGSINAVYGVLYALGGIFWGFFLDVVGIRKQLLICPFIMGLGAFGVGFLANDILTVTVFWAFVGFGAAGMMFAFVPKLVTTWFDASRRARGAMVIPLGGSLVGSLVGIFWPAIINATGDFRVVYIVMGVIEFALGIVMFIFARDEPADVGQVPWGSPKGTPVTRMYQPTPEGRAKKRHDLGKADIKVLKYPRTYLIAIPMIFYSINMTSTSSYLSPSLQAAGFTLAVAGLASSVTFIAKLCGQVIMPFFADKFPRKNVITVCWVIQGCSALTLAYVVVSSVASGMTPSIVIVFALVIFMSVFDSVNSILNTCNGESFPEDLRGTGPGIVSGFTFIGRYIGPIGAGALVAISPGMNFILGGTCIILGGIAAFLNYPKSGGKYGDPLAKASR